MKQKKHCTLFAEWNNNTVCFLKKTKKNENL